MPMEEEARDSSMGELLFRKRRYCVRHGRPEDHFLGFMPGLAVAEQMKQSNRKSVVDGAARCSAGNNTPCFGNKPP